MVEYKEVFVIEWEFVLVVIGEVNCCFDAGQVICDIVLFVYRTGAVRVPFNPDGVEVYMAVSDGAEEEVPCCAVCTTKSMTGESWGAAVEGSDDAKIVEDVGACGALWGSECCGVATKNF